MSPVQASPPTSKLFVPIKVGNMSLSHRVVMAPLSRLRTTIDTCTPLRVVKEYYSQRANTPGTFIISEGTLNGPGPSSAEYPGIPGIWSEEQINAWKEVVEAVHAKGSYIYLQIETLGRMAKSSALETLDAAYDVVSAGNIPIKPDGEIPRPMTADEIHNFIASYAQAAANAVLKAGFDGVEIQGANGLLLDQFLQDVSNNRTDEYGGSVENRARILLEVVRGVSRVVGEERTGIRLSPWNKWFGMGMKDPIPTYTYLIAQLKENHPKLAYLHLVETREPENPGESNEALCSIWSPRQLILAGGFTRDTALKMAEREEVLVAFGRHFIANPDLPLRLQADIPLSAYDRTTFYGGDESGKGYTDYPFASQ